MTFWREWNKSIRKTKFRKVEKTNLIWKQYARSIYQLSNFLFPHLKNFPTSCLFATSGTFGNHCEYYMKELS